MAEPTLICSSCQHPLPPSAFAISNKLKRGYQYRCKQCTRNWRQRNKFRLQDQKDKYRKKNIEAITERDRIYRKENRDKINVRQKQRYRERVLKG